MAAEGDELHEERSNAASPAPGPAATAAGAADGAADAAPAGDLDALIGDLRLEAARRRADPGYPIDLEAHLDAGLDQQSPHPPKPRLEAIASVLDDLAAAPPPAEPATRLSRLIPAGLTPAGRIPAGADPTPRLAQLAAAALRSASARLADLEARVRRLEGGPARQTRPFEIGTPGDPMEIRHWLPRLGEHVVGGRVLYWGAQPEDAVGALRAAGLDAYGVTPAGEEYRPGPDVHHGDLLDHLRSAGDASLAAVVVSGIIVRPDPRALGGLAAEMVRTVSGAVAVISEAPWSWARRLGPSAGDLAEARPLGPETWMEALTVAGLGTTAEYSPGGGAYLVVARPTR